MKRIMTVFGILVLAGTLTIPVFAHGPNSGQKGWSGGPGSCWQGSPGNDGLNEAQRDELNKLDQAFFSETAELRREIWNKQDELNLLLRASDPDTNKAMALQKELSGLRAKMAEHKLEYELKARKIAPERTFARGYGRGYHGRHMRGYGPHHRGGGYGPGSCWN